MRPLRLARAAAEAEVLRLRLLARRQTTRMVLAVVAGVFMLGTLVGLHVAGAIALARTMQTLWAVMIVAGIDLLVAILFGILALRNQPSAMEREAMRIRRTAQSELVQTMALTAIVSRVFRRR